MAEIALRLGVGTAAAPSRIGNFASVLGTLPAGILAEEILTSGPEQIRALIVVAGNPLLSVPGEARLRQALRQLDALICLDLFMNTTGHEADLLLPTTSWLERWDVAATTVMFQATSMIQYTGPVRPAPGEARSEARILADMSLVLGRPLLHSTVLTHLWRLLTWDAGLTALTKGLFLPARLLYRGAYGIPSLRPRPGRYLGRGPRTPGHRVRFWHPDLTAEPQRLADYAATLTMPDVTPEPHSTPTFTLICRRRRLGQNSWLHGAVHDGQAAGVAWMAPADCAALGLGSGSEVVLHTASAALQVPVLPVAEVLPGTVVLPHGLAAANVNALLPTGITMIEPLSGQHRMTGIPVRVTPVT
jgi:formate dehydrogenase